VKVLVPVHVGQAVLAYSAVFARPQVTPAGQKFTRQVAQRAAFMVDRVLDATISSSAWNRTTKGMETGSTALHEAAILRFFSITVRSRTFFSRRSRLPPLMLLLLLEDLARDRQGSM
jgi:hypothetical protein